MTVAGQYNGDLIVNGALRLSEGISPLKDRDDLLAVEERVKVIPFEGWREDDDHDGLLSETPTADYLGLVGGTFGTNHPSLQTLDVGGDAASATASARRTIEVPQDYVAGQSFKIRLHGGMHTTVADTTATADLEVHKCDGDRTVSADLASAASANNINSVTYSDVNFTITATTLTPGDLLDVRLSITTEDAGNSGADIRGVIGKVSLVYNGR